MTDRDPIWDALKDHSKAKFNADRERFMAQAIEQDDGGWTKYTLYCEKAEIRTALPSALSFPALNGGVCRAPDQPHT